MGSLCMHLAVMAWACFSPGGGAGTAASGAALGRGDLFIEFVSSAPVEVAQSAKPMLAQSSAALPPEQVTLEPEERVLPVQPHAPSALASSHPAEPHREGGPVPAAVSGGAAGNGDDLEMRYLAAVRAVIAAQWSASGARASVVRCKVTIEQQEGGAVVAARAMACADDEAVQRALEAAVLMAQPLPYAGFEGVFRHSREFELDLR